MKIAIIYTGMSETNEDILANHKNYIIDQYDVDIYVHTYDHDNKSLSLIKNILQPKLIVTDSIKDIEKTVSHKISNITTCMDNVRPVNALSMFYKWYSSLFCLNETNYDIVIRNRLDIKFTKPLQIFQNKFLNVPHGGDHLGGLMDLFCYGVTDVLKTYKQLYLNIDRYILSEKIPFHPETLLRHHIKQNSIEIRRFDFPIILRDEIFTNTAPTFF